MILYYWHHQPLQKLFWHNVVHFNSLQVLKFIMANQIICRCKCCKSLCHHYCIHCVTQIAEHSSSLSIYRDSFPFLCSHRFWEITHISISGWDVLQRLRTDISFRKWNNNTSSLYRNFFVSVSYPIRHTVLPRTGDFRPRPFHRGKQPQSPKVFIYSIWRGTPNVHR